MFFLHTCISKTLNDSRQKRYTEDDICHESQTTVKKVDVCPENNETLNKRSIERDCSRYQPCAGQQLVYHCVMNGGGLVEVCAPRSLITGRICPYYEKGLGRVIESPRKRCTMCPFQYQSDEYLKNSECVPASVTNEDSSGQSSLINVSIAKRKPSSTNKEISTIEGLRENDSTLTFEALGKTTEYGLNDESVASGEYLIKEDTEKHTDRNGNFTIYLVVAIIVCFCLALGVNLIRYYQKCLKTFCPKLEDGQKHINIQNESTHTQITDLCSESSEPMIILK